MGYLHTLYYIQMLKARDEARKQREKDEEERRKKQMGKKNSNAKDYRFKQMKSQLDSRNYTPQQLAEFKKLEAQQRMKAVQQQEAQN